MRSQRGQAATEYLGMLLAVVVLIGALATSGLGDAVANHLRSLVTLEAQAAPKPLEPSTDRYAPVYEANRSAVNAEIARLRALGVPDTDARLRKLIELSAPGRNFLVFDPRGDGRIVEVFGDLTTAQHVAIVVPGMNNELSNYSGADARTLQEAAGEGTATIQWLGYDTPEGATGATGGPANEGAESLDGFLASLGADAHVTIVGHSYGSLVLGVALRREGIEVDDAVALGSPGMGVDDADDLGESFERLWAARARWDAVGHAPFHGEDPHASGFGARRFHTGDISGHSSYFAPGSLSLANLAAIVEGRDQEVVLLD